MLINEIKFYLKKYFYSISYQLVTTNYNVDYEPGQRIDYNKAKDHIPICLLAKGITVATTDAPKENNPHGIRPDDFPGISTLAVLSLLQPVDCSLFRILIGSS